MTRTATILTHLLQIALAAHFLREGNFFLVLLTLVVLVTLWSRQLWAVVLNQIALAGGAVIWVGTAGQVLEKRLDAGRPYARMLAILLTVAALAVATAVLWAVPRIRRTWLRNTGVPHGQLQAH